MNKKYEDIIHLDRPVSKKHKPMSIENRAAQFAPFAALVGYDEVINEKGRMTDEQLILNEDQAFDINNKLLYLIENKDVVATYTYFVKDKRKKGGAYFSSVGTIKKIDYEKHQIVLNDKSIINIDDLSEIIY